MANADLEIAKRLLQYRHHFDNETKKAEEFEAQAQTIRAHISAQKARVDQGLPAPDACPNCWVQHGKKVTVSPRSTINSTDGVARAVAGVSTFWRDSCGLKAFYAEQITQARALVQFDSPLL